MKRVPLAILAVLALATPAQARQGWAKVPHHRHAVASSSSVSVCPFDGPEQQYRIVNAGVTGVTLQQIAAVMTATRDESFALRWYYGTPCASFGAGGTPVYLSNGYEPLSGGGYTYQLGGWHYPSAIYVQTGLTPYTNWARVFSHEIMEHLVNPNGDKVVTLPNGSSWKEEVCDPVENLTIEVDQLRVSDFVTPAWFNGSHTGPWDAGHHLTGPA